MRKFLSLLAVACMAMAVSAQSSTVTCDFTDASYRAAHPIETGKYDTIVCSESPVTVYLRDDLLRYSTDSSCVYMSASKSVVRISVEEGYEITMLQIFLTECEGNSHFGLQHMDLDGDDGVALYSGPSLSYDWVHHREYYRSYLGDQSLEWRCYLNGIYPVCIDSIVVSYAIPFHPVIATPVPCNLGYLKTINGSVDSTFVLHVTGQDLSSDVTFSIKEGENGFTLQQASLPITDGACEADVPFHFLSFNKGIFRDTVVVRSGEYTFEVPVQATVVPDWKEEWAGNDTLSYTLDSTFTNDYMGMQSCSNYWSSIYAAADIAGRKYVNSALIYAPLEGLYDVGISFKDYDDYEDPEFAFYQADNYLEVGWNTIEFTTSVPIVSGKDMWLVFHSDLIMPMACVGYVGEMGSNVFKTCDEFWVPMLLYHEENYYSWMMGVVTSDQPLPTALDNENQNENQYRKVIHNDQLIIIREGVRYNALGQSVD